MVVKKFSTKNADYILELRRHIGLNKKNVFSGVDALVIETGEYSYGVNTIKSLEHHPQMATPINYCKQNNLPIYMTDINVTSLGDYRSSVATLPITPVEVMLYWKYLNTSFDIEKIMLMEEKENKILRTLEKYGNVLLQSPIAAGREAINSTKIENYLVKQLGKKLNRKPKIGIEFGSAHSSLEIFLKNKFIRDFTVWNFEKFNFEKWNSFEKKNLNKLYEARYTCFGWTGIEHELDLFKV